MARHSAITAVASAVVTALNVAAVRAVAPGGVHRNRPPNQPPPYVMVGPCSETPWDASGPNRGAAVRVPVTVKTSGQQAAGEAQAVAIADVVMSLLDVRTAIAVTGWTVCDIWWQGTAVNEDPQDDGLMGYAAVATFVVQVRQA